MHAHLGAVNAVLLALFLHGALRVGDGGAEDVAVVECAAAGMHAARDEPQRRRGTVAGLGVRLDALADVRREVRHALVVLGDLHACAASCYKRLARRKPSRPAAGAACMRHRHSVVQRPSRRRRSVLHTHGGGFKCAPLPCGGVLFNSCRGAHLGSPEGGGIHDAPLKELLERRAPQGGGLPRRAPQGGGDPRCAPVGQAEARCMLRPAAQPRKPHWSAAAEACRAASMHGVHA